MGSIIERSMDVYTDWQWTQERETPATEDDFFSRRDELAALGWSIMREEAGATFRLAAFSMGDVNRDITYTYPDDEARIREQRYYS